MSRHRPKNARQVALRALRRAQKKDDAFSNRVLSSELERVPGMQARDRGLATTLFYGVLRHRTRLDRHIDAFAHDPKKLKGEPREILRIAALELVELGHPLHVASAEAVKLSRDIDPRGRLKGLITAITAGIDRDAAVLDVAMLDGERVDALVQRFSIPAWLAERWVAALGPERALARASALARAPHMDLRVDVSRVSLDAVKTALEAERPGIILEAGFESEPQLLRARGGGDLFFGPLHEDGKISVQARGSQRAASVLSPRPGERVLDACCGMGVKTLQLAELMQRRGAIVAADNDARRLAQLEEVTRRGQLDQAMASREFQLDVMEGDLCDPELDLGEPFSAILLDAPCSGLGNLARHPELRWQARADALRGHAELQQRLLEHCARRLVPGGRLVYAVCSLEPEEGPQVVRAAAQATRLQIDTEERTTPEDHDSDGFYLALLRV